ncbi:unnamed protein product [Merluccius merluccius]
MVAGISVARRREYMFIGSGDTGVQVLPKAFSMETRWATHSSLRWATEAPATTWSEDLIGSPELLTHGPSLLRS